MKPAAQDDANQADVDVRIAEIDRIGREIARVHANAVDDKSRFPIEAITALKVAGIFCCTYSY